MINSLDSNNFQSVISTSKLPIVIDLWAEWCGPCKMLLPIIEKVSQKLLDKVNFYKVNIDENPDIAEKFNVRTIPTLLVFLDGKVVATHSGLMEAESLEKWIENHLS